METSKLSLLLSLVGAAALQLHAQPASPEAQDKALELLRQTISQKQSPTISAPSAPQPVVVTPAPVVATTPAVPASSDQQEQAVMLLRQTMAQQPQAAAPAAPAKPKSSQPSAKSTKPKSSGTTSATVSQAPAPDTASPAPAAPAGLTTKQQRLADLLEQYRADKLTPAEYQAERAKILAEP